VFFLDNARIHCTAEIESIFLQSGCTFAYSSPYSPDLNPIEMVFGWIKNSIKKFNYSVHNITEIVQEQVNKLDYKIMYGFIKTCSKRWRNSTYV
jgi:transposase